jgi:hypothetical protein
MQREPLNCTIFRIFSPCTRWLVELRFGCAGQRPPYQEAQRKDMHPIVPRRRPNPPCFMHLFRSARLDEISSRRTPQSEPFFGPFGPPGRPRGPLPPSNCAKIAGAGASPPPARCTPPCAAARRPGWATPSPKPPRGGV